MIGRRDKGHLDDAALARFVDEGERIDSLPAEQLRHLTGCPHCQGLLHGHRRARALLLRHDPAAEMPAVVRTTNVRLTPAFATFGLVALALIVAAGAFGRWSSTASTTEPTPSEVAVASTSATATETIGATESAEPTPSEEPTGTKEPTISPTATPAQTPTPAPTPRATPTPVDWCSSTDLTVAIVAHHGGMPDPLYWEGDMGRLYGTFVLTNVSKTACVVNGLSQPQLINGDGTILIEGGIVAPAPRKTMQPGQTLTAVVVSADLCGAPPIVAPVTVGFVMEDGKAVVAPPISPTDTLAVPPCTSDPSGQSGDIAIQNPGWH